MSTLASPWRIAGFAVALAAGFTLRWSTVHPWRMLESEQARVRQSWSARPERVERCRRLSDDELAKLPSHMRLRTQCEGGSARYLFTLSVDERVVARDTLRGGGLRHDRPIHVFGEVAIDAGARHVHLEVVRLDSAITDEHETGREQVAERVDTLLGGRAARETDERTRRASEALPSRLILDTTMMLPPRRVVLVAYDDIRQRLFARTER
jgi:hypothetical protein